MLELEKQHFGATELRTLLPGSPDYRRWIDIGADAYPVIGLTTRERRDAAFEAQRDIAEREPGHRVVGAYRGGVLVGGMRVYDFTMCVRGAQVFTGGVGSVAVGLEHKRRGIARDLIAGFLREYRERGAALATLYPFRPDFYAAMGFGYGAKMNQYRIALTSLAADGPRECIRALVPDDVDACQATYARVQSTTNGLIRRERYRAEAQLANPSMRTFGYFESGRLRGYLAVEARLGKGGTTNRNELFVHELTYETPVALNALLAFARSQSDQYAVLVVNTQDPEFHFAVPDARNGSDRNLYPPVYHETNVQGVGVMYRVLDVRSLVEALADCRFGALDGVVRIGLTDSFVEANAAAYAIRFRGGRPALVAPQTPADVDVAIGVADFSSLAMGAVRLRSLVAYGRAVLSNPELLGPLDSAFDAQPPRCQTRF